MTATKKILLLEDESAGVSFIQDTLSELEVELMVRDNIELAKKVLQTK